MITDIPELLSIGIVREQDYAVVPDDDVVIIGLRVRRPRNVPAFTPVTTLPWPPNKKSLPQPPKI